jgi:hypothetical protein
VGCVIRRQLSPEQVFVIDNAFSPMSRFGNFKLHILSVKNHENKNIEKFLLD